MLPDGNRPSTGYARFDAGTVNMRIATSLIGTAQAKHNLELELTAGDTVESVRDRAQRRWDDKLDTVEVEGATDDQRTTLYSNLYRLFLYPNSAHENTGSATNPAWKHAVQSSHRHAGQQRDEDGRARRRRQGLRQQRLLGHLPDHLVGVLAVHAARRRRDGRRLRPAVPRRRLDRALVVTRLREPDDGHELRRRVRRRIRQGRAGPQGPRHLRRRGEERDGGAAGRPVEPEHRPQGPDRGAVPRLHAVARVRGRLVGARGRHQRLRHRQHGGEAGGRDQQPGPEAAAAGGAGVLPQPLAELREHVRPGDPLLPGARRVRALEVEPDRTTTRGSGATSTTTRRPTAGTSRSTPRTTGRGSPTSTAAATPSRASSTRSSPPRRPPTSPAPTAARSTR